MATSDRINDKAKEAKGRVKEATGALTGNRDLKDSGRKDQVKARAGEVREDLKDAKEFLGEAWEKTKDAASRR
jgi:uncharacterized protein YjbJ (UPF0337 family)